MGKRLNKQQGIATGGNYLLAIGINAYKHFTKLYNARKDVQDFGILLTEQFGFLPDEPYSQYLLDQDATRRNILRKLHQLCDLVEPEDRVLIYYSGHGYLNPRNLGYWIPVNAEKEEVGDYIANAEIRDVIKVMPCRHVLLISDSCFSGALLVRDATRRNEGSISQWELNASRWVFCSWQRSGFRW